jgi:hypothetical protein
MPALAQQFQVGQSCRSAALQKAIADNLHAMPVFSGRAWFKGPAGNAVADVRRTRRRDDGLRDIRSPQRNG